MAGGFCQRMDEFAAKTADIYEQSMHNYLKMKVEKVKKSDKSDAIISSNVSSTIDKEQVETTGEPISQAKPAEEADAHFHDVIINSTSKSYTPLRNQQDVVMAEANNNNSNNIDDDNDDDEDDAPRVKRIRLDN